MNSCLKRNQKLNELSKKVENNPYVKRALYLAIIAFGLSFFHGQGLGMSEQIYGCVF